MKERMGECFKTMFYNEWLIANHAKLFKLITNKEIYDQNNVKMYN